MNFSVIVTPSEVLKKALSVMTADGGNGELMSCTRDGLGNPVFYILRHSKGEFDNLTKTLITG
jgi:hypothetical protein